MKKIVLIIFTATILNFALSGTIFAGPYGPPSDNPPKAVEAPKGLTESENQKLIEATFDVGDILTLPDGEQPAKYYNSKEGALVAFILEIMNYATAIIGSIALILLIVAGFVMMLSGGNQQTVDKAKDIFKYAIIGLIVTFLSYIIVLFIQSVFITKASQT